MMMWLDVVVIGLFLMSSLLLLRWLVQGSGEALQRVRLIAEYFAVTLSLAVLGYGLERVAFLPELMHQLTLLMVIIALMAGLTVPSLARWRLARA
ncbi:hypothetical protein [Parathalassolituus penaei]|uniref:Uncharacterized protein n=1 Tax=Parathalassolituus penaei TaxID=2997323 RepID=A0A9X3ISV4_9GAMM|nr:hypothetical protein [Parathalassolituus penaei]MCY0966231.1 hypothetical protein [Parathalassolituus penaei]